MLKAMVITINGVEHTIKEWSEISGVKDDIIRSRLRRGITGTKLLAPVEKTITINGEAHTFSEWSRITGVSYNTLKTRYRKGIKGEDLIVPARITKKEMHEIWGVFVWKGDK